MKFLTPTLAVRLESLFSTSRFTSSKLLCCVRPIPGYCSFQVTNISNAGKYCFLRVMHSPFDCYKKQNDMIVFIVYSPPVRKSKSVYLSCELNVGTLALQLL